MAGYLKCVECSGTFKKLYEDPRTPPVDIGKCMCWWCTDAAHDEVVETAEEEFLDAKINQVNHQRKQ